MVDLSQFESFLRRYQDLVYATALRLLGQPADAEDIAQQVFLRAYDRFAQIGSSPTAGGWLKTVTTNLCLNHLSRYRARWRFFSEMETGSANGDVTIAESAVVEDRDAEELRAERRQRLEAALQRLPDHQRVPLVLFHFQSMSYEAIAARLGVSVGKIKTDIHRGRLALRRQVSTETEFIERPVPPRRN
jgi:RNA polymerase sigma-70 factor (ECF subfamily)